MGRDTAIAWTHHTFNPFWGCEHWHEGCANCYAAGFANRLGLEIWGKSPRRFFGDKHWNEPLVWNKAAQDQRTMKLVFCASMADVFEDRDDLIPHRQRLFELIDHTPWLVWQLLTKRPSNINRMLPIGWRNHVRRNVWFGCSPCNQRTLEMEKDGVHDLLDIGGYTRFLSVEPILGPLDLKNYLPRIQWVIVGGESGPRARPCDVQWIDPIIGDCRDSRTALFIKQMGSNPRIGGEPWKLKPKGDDPSEWPAHLRIRELPAASCRAPATPRPMRPTLGSSHE